MFKMLIHYWITSLILKTCLFLAKIILKAKIKCLEKDLYFYKKGSRELKQQLIDLNKRIIL